MDNDFYDQMADHFHLIFEDWNASMRHQGAAIAKLLPQPEEAGLILDVACGIGTQSLALAALGYAVTGSDISTAAVARANREAVARSLSCTFRVDDMRTLESAKVGKYGAVIAFDNALPHLDRDDDIAATFSAIRARLAPGGKSIISVRDYDRLLRKRPTFTPAAFFGDRGSRRIVFQVWDWLDERRYVVHQHVEETAHGWVAHHFVGQYRAVTTDELSRLANQAGLRRVCVLPPDDTGFYQPIIVAEVD